MLTPEQVHFGQADDVIARRTTVLNTAWTAHPERFVRGLPKPKPLPEAVWINPPTSSLSHTGNCSLINGDYSEWCPGIILQGSSGSGGESLVSFM